MTIIQDSFLGAWQFLLMASPFMLLGLAISGLLRSVISPATISKYLGNNSLKSIISAALFGVPLPLCSCGVVPTAIALRKQGASRGAVLAFLISTPESGVDSIAMTYALIDPIMAVARPVAALLSGIIAGITDLFLGTKDPMEMAAESCSSCTDNANQHSHNQLPFLQRLRDGFHFAFVTLLNDIGGWFLIGVFAAGVISVLVPQSLIEQYLGGGIVSMLLILAISVPLYICAAGSTPIAAALILKGMSPGAALVLLMAGPATNAASIVVLSKFLGIRSTIIYLSTIVVMSFTFGLTLDAIYAAFHISPTIADHIMDHDMSNAWEFPSTVVLLLLLVWAKWQSRKTS